MRMSNQAQDGGAGAGAGMPSLQMDGPGAWPFLPDDPRLKSPVVAEELEKLVRDNKSLVKMGEQYRKFDRLGRLMYIDQIEAIEERWRLFIARFELMGALNPEFVEQQDAYLKGLQIGSVKDFEDLLSNARSIMRGDAEREG